MEGTDKEKKSRWRFLLPVAKGISRLFSIGRKETAQKDIEALLNEMEGFYIIRSSGEGVRKEYRYEHIWGRPRVVAVNPLAMKAYLKELGAEKDPRKLVKAFNRLIKALESGEKPIMYIPLQRLYLRAAVKIYKRLKERLGDRLKAFAITGSILTGNVDGVPVKVVKLPSRRRMGMEMKVKFGHLDDLDLAMVVEGINDDERKKIKEIMEEEMEKSGLPRSRSHLEPGVLDTTKPFILSPEDKAQMAHYFHREKPIRFLEEKHRKWMKKLIRELEEKDEEFSELLKKEELEYRQKRSLYKDVLDQEFYKVFNRAKEELKSGGRLSPEERAISEHLDLFLHLFDSLYFREMVDDLIMEHIKTAVAEGKSVSEANRELRLALSRVINSYMEAASRLYGEDIKEGLLDRFEVVRTSKKTYRDLTKRLRRRSSR